MNLSRLSLFFIITLILLSPVLASADIIREGRKIQLDGFLMDWMEKNRQPWSGSTQWSWDAVNTEEGVAGYFHAAGAAPCSSWVFTVDDGSHGPREMVVSNVNGVDGSWYRVNLNRQGGGNQVMVTVEWLLPWDSIAIGPDGSCAIQISGKSACGDSLEPVLLTGRKKAASGNLPGRFIERLGLIVVLLAVFIVLQLKIRKKRLRKGSPHQSA